MKNFKIVSLALFALVLAAVPAFAQTALTQTSLSAAITVNQTTFAIASATNVTASNTAPTVLYVVDPGQYKGELMTVKAISGTTVTVSRTGINKAAHASGSMVLVGPPKAFAQYDPVGSCTASQTAYTPWVNAVTGSQWLCSTVTGNWVPGFGNDLYPTNVTAAVASAAGLITPSGPLFHITGTAAITGFNIPVGFNGGMICGIPDGLSTTTSANNFALATTAVVSKPICWVYDTNTAKFYPSY